MSRPEKIAPPEMFYNDACVVRRSFRAFCRVRLRSPPPSDRPPPRSEAGKYTQNTRMMAIQAAMAQRCIELLSFAEGEPKLVLDIGCGSGLSGGETAAAGRGVALAAPAASSVNPIALPYPRPRHPSQTS